MSAKTGTLYWLPVILDDESLDAVETLLMVTLADHINEQDECYVGIATLARAARCSYNTARRRLSALEQRGKIQRTRRFRDDGGQSVYDYQLVRDPAPNLGGGVRPPGWAGGSAHPGGRAEPPRKEPPRKKKPGGLFDDEDQGPGIDRPDPVVAGFEECWSIYPKHERRKEALTAYRARIRSGTSPGVLLRCVRNYAETVRQTDPRFVMLGASFFGPSDRWRDYEHARSDEPQAQEEV